MESNNEYQIMLNELEQMVGEPIIVDRSLEENELNPRLSLEASDGYNRHGNLDLVFI